MLATARQSASVCRVLAVLLLGACALPCTLHANPRSIELRRLGYIHAFNLDHDKALATFTEAVNADPADPGAYRALAVNAWMHLLYLRGSITVDDYLGSTTKPNVKLKTPPPELAQRFRTNIDKALQLAESGLRTRPNDPNAHYDVGAAVGQIAAYAATVDGKLFDGFKAARRAFTAHERVLELDRSRQDAGLIIGTYRYIVANLNWALRGMAYLVGFGGGREKAIEALEACGRYPSDVQIDARIALVLIYNREKRFDAAIRILDGLREQYPRNRLLWLETGATYIRAGRPADALPALDAGIAKFEADDRPKAFGEAALWYLKRGTARLAAGLRDEAATDLRHALTVEARDWTRGRTHIELGKLSDLAGRRAEATSAYQKGAGICRQDNDPLGAAEADRFLQKAYTGTISGKPRQN